MFDPDPSDWRSRPQCSQVQRWSELESKSSSTADDLLRTRRGDEAGDKWRCAFGVCALVTILGVCIASFVFTLRGKPTLPNNNYANTPLRAVP